MDSHVYHRVTSPFLLILLCSIMLLNKLKQRQTKMFKMLRYQLLKLFVSHLLKPKDVGQSKKEM